MTQADKALIEKECRIIKDFKVEHAVWYYRGRKEKVGEESEIYLNDEEAKQLKNRIFIHNHPDNRENNQFSLCYLSPEDLYLAFMTQAKGCASVTKEGIICAFFPNKQVSVFSKEDTIPKINCRVQQMYDKTRDLEKSIRTGIKTYKKHLIDFCRLYNLEIHFWRLK